MLAPLDWVMASVHTSFDKDPTERVLAAMESPHVDCIGHLTSRRIGVRNPSTIEVEKVVEGALATGTFLEINSQPDRLDLRDAHARLAGEAGVTLVDLERRPLGEGAPLRRARRRAGAPRLADEGADPEHAPVAGDREAAQVTLPRGRGRGARVGRVLPRARPRAPGSRPGGAGRAPRAAAGRAARDGGAVRGRPARPGRGAAARAHALAEPALLRLLPQHRLRARDPGGAARPPA